jgi:hypothetical protein
MAQTNVQAFSGDVEISSDLAVNTDDLFVDTVNSRVGIGTDNPGLKLEVLTGNGANYGLRLRRGSGAAFTDLGHLSTPGTEGLAFNVSDGISATQEVMRVAGTGDVGIGTDTPRAKMDIYTGSTSTAGIILDRYATGNYRSELYQASNGLSIHVGNADTAPSEKLLIHHDGTVTATTFSGALDGNADTATILETTRTINGVNFNGSENIVVEPYISDYNSGDTTCYLVFTNDSTAGYKRLYEDSGLSYDNTANKLTATTFDGDLDGNADTATTLATTRTINGVNFNGSANITVEPYISNDNTGDTSCHIVFTQNSDAGYKRLYEDDGLKYDNTNNRLLTYEYHTIDGGFGFTAYEIKIRQTNNVNYYQGIGYLYSGSHKVFMSATPNGDGIYGNNQVSGMINKGRFGPADWTDGLGLAYSRYDSSWGSYPVINWYVNNQGNHGRVVINLSLYNGNTNNQPFYFQIGAVGRNSSALLKSYTNQW